MQHLDITNILQTARSERQEQYDRTIGVVLQAMQSGPVRDALNTACANMRIPVEAILEQTPNTPRWGRDTGALMEFTLPVPLPESAHPVTLMFHVFQSSGQYRAVLLHTTSKQEGELLKQWQPRPNERPPAKTVEDARHLGQILLNAAEQSEQQITAVRVTRAEQDPVAAAILAVGGDIVAEMKVMNEKLDSISNYLSSIDIGVNN